MSIDRKQLKSTLAKLKAIRTSIPVGERVIQEHYADDYGALLAEVQAALGDEDLAFFTLPPSTPVRIEGLSPGGIWVEHFNSKLLQLIAHLEAALNDSSEVIKVGTLFNSIIDEKLRSRCSDLLSAEDNFDRAINQATQILEDRIREKSEADSKLSGITLVNTVVKVDPKNTLLLVSQDQGEQEGFSHIVRGMVGAFRNPTHHEISDRFTREDALKVCAFVDLLLQVIDDATVVSST
ncbi:MAG: TIGR02391 family protein [Alphaproteobacteria bacterium]|jgi:uncharacterized protein (TIGR02391 family)|nr:TIGR02391 family protein [Alphaproteobacteria bacterium]